MTLRELRGDMADAASPARAKANAWFFKTGKGQYGEGDEFIGLTVPQARFIAKKYRDLSTKDVERVLRSRIHEERMIGFLILVGRFDRSDEKGRKECFDFYLGHADRANNWDLVDQTAPRIVGAWLLDRPTGVLDRLARSRDLWRRRISIVATLFFIKEGRLGETFRIADALLGDRHDLIHKATGWMLREAGKRDKQALVAWLKPRYKKMPRTMLRYAIERFPEHERRRYLLGRV